MNSVELFLQHAKARSEKMAIWVPGSTAVSFGELLEMGGRAQKMCREQGVGPGDHVLLIDHLGPRLYAAVTGILALGACVVLVEPWMPVAKIERVISAVKPKLFITNMLGRLWGMRVAAVRRIPRWIHPRAIVSSRSNGMEAESVDEGMPGILTFTSGTTGNPKGVVRNQGYLTHQHSVLSSALHLDRFDGPDLCIFANFALANLASGRGSIIVPPAWKAKHLRALANLDGELAPRSLTTGPAFLMRLMDEVRLPSLESIHVGGALTDCWIFEKAFAHFPQAHFSHIYGSSEAEPVALADAHEAVRLSRAAGYFQTLFLGQPVPQISAAVEPDGVWVAGPHVCPRYVGNEEENRLNKREDELKRIWHFMGDRVRVDQNGWWYAGRSSQDPNLFELEQNIYAELETSAGFVQMEDGQPAVYLQRADDRVPWLQGFLSQRDDLRALLQQAKFYEVEIRRDRRHRARIDRVASLKTRRLWQAG